MEMMLLCSYDEWVQAGYQCDILAVATDVGLLSDELESAGYVIHHVPFRGRWRYFPDPGFLRNYWRLCRSGYDIVHVHTEAAALLFTVIAKLAGVQSLAITPHNTFRFTGLLWMRKYLERAMIRMMGARYGMISDDVLHCEKELYDNEGVRTINWINSDRYLPASEAQRLQARKRLGVADNAFLIVSVGNCNTAKNHPALLQAIAKVPSDISILYVHIGREPENHPERDLASNLGIADQVQFMGTQQDPLPFLQAADTFVMPSLWEGLGMAAIEAIAVGVPVLLTDTPGLREVASHTRHAVMVEPEAFSLAKGLEQIARIPAADRHRMALIDSERIRQQFSIKMGVTSIVRGLYEPDRASMPDEQAEGCHGNNG